MTSLVLSGTITNLLLSNILITGSTTTIPIINTLELGSYIASYQAIDALGTIAYNTRIINLVMVPPTVITYDLSGGASLGPIVNSYNVLSSSDWTAEFWINTSNREGIYYFFDTGTPTSGDTGRLRLIYFNNDKHRGANGILQVINGNIFCNFIYNLPENIWTHIAFMLKNNICYCFVNGISLSSPITISSNFIIDAQNISIGRYSSVLPNLNQNILWGTICQPLIRLGAQYNILGFTPTWNLKPKNYNNVLLWLSNNVEVISNQVIPFNTANGYSPITSTLPYLINKIPLSMSGLIFFASPASYNSTNNTWTDIANNYLLNISSNLAWNSNGNYFDILNNNITNNLSITSNNLIITTKTLFIVLSIPSTPYNNKIIFGNVDLGVGHADMFVGIEGGNYYGNLSIGYTDGIQNNIRRDGKFHVYIVSGVDWQIGTTLYFGSYQGGADLCFQKGSRIAAIGILDHTITSTEINTIQSWFIDSNFTIL